jgi:predicted component of type VI protein secretion system
MKMT